jgi:predicted dehydrogenase
MNTIKRRDFLKTSVAGAAAVSSLGARRRAAASDRLVVGLMGVGGRGTRLAEVLLERDDIDIAYICDVDSRRFARVLEVLDEHGAPRPQMVEDFRRILDDPAVDILVNATPDHWHALGTVMACQAGKDVFVEKPLAHDIVEGRRMVEAARKYERVVQVGLQSRSAPYVEKARQYIRDGGLGEVRLVKVFNQMKHNPRPRGPQRPAPSGFNWDLWCGPAPRLPYSPGRWWFDRWDYSCGAILGDAIHQLDLARWIVSLGTPRSVQQSGHVHHMGEDCEIPDTQVAMFEFDDVTLVFESALWMPYQKKIPVSVRDSDRLPNWPFCSTRVEVYGTEEQMLFGRHGGGWQVFGPDDVEPVAQEYGRQADARHLEDFVSAIRSRTTPAADVEEGHVSTLVGHMANISFRAGNRQLFFDPESETFTNSEEANQYLGRSYREPWVMPDEV